MSDGDFFLISFEEGKLMSLIMCCPVCRSRIGYEMVLYDWSGGVTRTRRRLTFQATKSDMVASLVCWVDIVWRVV